MAGSCMSSTKTEELIVSVHHVKKIMIVLPQDIADAHYPKLAENDGTKERAYPMKVTMENMIGQKVEEALKNPKLQEFFTNKDKQMDWEKESKFPPGYNFKQKQTEAALQTDPNGQKADPNSPSVPALDKGDGQAAPKKTDDPKKAIPEPEPEMPAVLPPCPPIGPIQYADLSTYTGQYKEGKRHGRGRLVFKDGSLYEGLFVDDKFSIWGFHIHPGGDFYSGEYKDGLPNGTGHFDNGDNVIYDGSWKDGKQNGHGVEVQVGKATYVGQFKNSMKEGYGKFDWIDKTYYHGQFANNDLHGVGRYHWNDGRDYHGQWRRNKMNGIGKYKWSDQKYYIGFYLEDKKHGKGFYHWPNNSVYAGEWKEGKQHGTADFKHYKENDEIEEFRNCKWHDGTMVDTGEKRTGGDVQDVIYPVEEFVRAEYERIVSQSNAKSHHETNINVNIMENSQVPGSPTGLTKAISRSEVKGDTTPGQSKIFSNMDPKGDTNSQAPNLPKVVSGPLK